MFVRGEMSIQDIVGQYLQGAKAVDREHFDGFYQDFCEDKGLEPSEKESLESFIRLNKKLLSNLYGSFKVEVLSDSFFNSLSETNLESALNGRNLYEVLGNTTGILLFPDSGYMMYSIMEDGATFQYHEPGNEPFLQYSYNFGKFDTDLLSNKESDIFLSALYTTLNVLLLKRVGKVQTIMVAKETNRTIGNDRVVNRMPFAIHRLDSAWFKTIVSTKTFGVRGHWRLQACGKRWEEHKLVFIAPHQRHGFVRRAPALIARESA